MLVSLAVFITAFSSTTGQIPTLSLSPNPVELGQNYTLVCTVSINSAINFIRSGNNEGSCPPPFLGTPCTPPEITQNSDKTSWIRTSTSTNDEGSWTCVRSTSVSNVVSLDMFACADNVMSESGINSNVTLNETSAITISVKIGCIYPSAASINLMLKPSSSSIPPFKMSCTADTLPCTIGSAYECTHEIAGNVTSDEGEYTVHVEGLPTIGNCSNSLQLFDGYYIKFKQNQGSETTTDEPTTREYSTNFDSTIATQTYSSTTTSLGIDSTENVISTDLHTMPPSNTSLESTPKNLFTPLVTSVSVASFCLFLLVAISFCIMYFKRDKKKLTRNIEKGPSNDFLETQSSQNYKSRKKQRRYNDDSNCGNNSDPAAIDAFQIERARRNHTRYTNDIYRMNWELAEMQQDFGDGIVRPTAYPYNRQYGHNIQIYNGRTQKRMYSHDPNLYPYDYYY